MLEHPNIVKLVGVTENSSKRLGAVLRFVPWNLEVKAKHVEPGYVTFGMLNVCLSGSA